MEELMSIGGYLAASVALLLIGFLGFFSNLIVIALMCRDKQLWTPLNVILFNLVVSDLSVSVFGNPFALISALHRSWVFGKALCIAYGFFMSLLGISSITTMTVLALERYLIISRPLSGGHLNWRGAIFCVIAIWLYAAALTTPPLFGWGEYGYEAANISCSVNWETRDHNSSSYIVFLFAFGFFVPIVAICYSYTNIIITMKKSTVAMGRVSKAETRVAWMIGVMIAAFFFAWTPYALLSLLIAYLGVHVSPALALIPSLVAKTSICYNPIIYVGLNTQFRMAWRKLLKLEQTDEECQAPASLTRLTGGVSPRITGKSEQQHETSM